MMNTMMAETLTIGTAHKATLPGWPAAGKTGTSQDFRDAWFIGYTAHLVTGLAWQRRRTHQARHRRQPAGGNLEPLHARRASGRAGRSLPGSSSGGLFSGLFGGQSRPTPPPRYSRSRPIIPATTGSGSTAGCSTTCSDAAEFSACRTAADTARRQPKRSGRTTHHRHAKNEWPGALSQEPANDRATYSRRALLDESNSDDASAARSGNGVIAPGCLAAAPSPDRQIDGDRQYQRQRRRQPDCDRRNHAKPANGTGTATETKHTVEPHP